MIFNPHDYQKHCIDKVIEMPALALWLDMGLGKTVIVLTAINELKYNRLQVHKVLVVAPKKVAEATWQVEAKKWDHLRLLRFSAVMGTAKQRERALAVAADVYVMGRDNVDWLVQYYRNDWPFDMVVLDESSSFKNPQSKRFKRMKAVRPHIHRMVELTGTPSPQGLIDLWAQIFLLDGGQRLGRTLGSFRDNYFLPDKRNAERVFTYKPRGGAEQTVKELLSDICISMKAEDYLSLPEKMENDIPVVLDPAADKAYTRLERDMLLMVEEEMVTAGTAGVLSNKLLQLCNGALYDDEGQAHEIHKCKLEAFLELVESLCGQHALVFYAYRHDRDRILQALGKRANVRCLEGPQDAEDWNAGKVEILLAHPASCAYGLNLQEGGRHVIWFGLCWSLELTQQANARLYRQGQKMPVIVHRLIVQGGRDQDVVAALESKDDVQESLLQSLKARIAAVKGGRR
ncbi:DEAD/DEAH box helicase [Ruminococcaceae bacterium OttesenSCG-928-I18]|nr:DEAD/DEAH box helicase [Ruminococcaceae bacterium OttesenSCG-928-I18]